LVPPGSVGSRKGPAKGYSEFFRKNHFFLGKRLVHVTFDVPDGVGMPRKGGHGNECSKDEIEPIYDQLITPVKHGKDARDVVETAAKETPTRTRQKFSEEFKLHCANQHQAWIALGRPHGFSPGPTLQQQYGVTKDFAKECHAKMLAGKLKDQRASKSGRKLVFGEETLKEVQTVIRARRDIKRKAPSGLIKAELTNKRRKEAEPARRSSKRKASTPLSEATSMQSPLAARLTLISTLHVLCAHPRTQPRPVCMRCSFVRAATWALMLSALS
jgi:hypothetical protein